MLPKSHKPEGRVSGTHSLNGSRRRCPGWGPARTAGPGPRVLPMVPTACVTLEDGLSCLVCETDTVSAVNQAPTHGLPDFTREHRSLQTSVPIAAF